MPTDISQDINACVKGKVRYNEPMSRHTSFRIGGPADIWIEPDNIDDIKKCVRLCRESGTPLFVIGAGTNLLVSDEGIRGVVINMRSPALKNFFWGERRLTVTSSVSLKELLDFCRANALSGLEFLSGIPGTVGGSVTTNAGARNCEKKEKWYSVGGLIEEIKVMDSHGEAHILDKRELRFGYRKFELSDHILLEIKFLLTKSTKEAVVRECRKYLEIKKSTQELSASSAGCVFKNPEGSLKGAGQLIDECGLKGRKIGGASISRKHANFIINTGSALSSNVAGLMEIMHLSVKNKFGINLTPEIKIV